MSVGIQEGDRCNRLDDDGLRCDGTMSLMPVDNCTCHISPPCGACLDNQPICDVCDAPASDLE